MSTADQQRRWRASQGARTGTPGRRATEPCGTPAAYRRHKRRGEDPCDPCKAAWSAKQHEYYEARKRVPPDDGDEGD